MLIIPFWGPNCKIGQIEAGTPSDIDQHIPVDACAKFGALVQRVTIFAKYDSKPPHYKGNPSDRAKKPAGDDGPILPPFISPPESRKFQNLKLKKKN